ncbi:type II toxin-antitoxin system PemK/MazF family toxin [Algiphilus sp. W345]|uniref:Type II toxin-antitoxin system PemK/MazF family toxin n=1 Tax=Banduia mediterranea TaxID=3075609 RepID=A0ABU2WMW9_9GAMM|nr:type II toxin-antitoxin system PemK/MazF family toxin [Algiphilus sp. W345]MDT0498959.1 type II toxin-antitoxin system PemK/MazF family toxin [Algiphilus sp. W345]
MPTTTGSSFGDVVLVAFPFTDQSGTKQRPAVVVSSSAYQRQRPDLILLAITSQVRPRLGFGEALVQDWQGAGLIKPSVLKPIVFTAEKSIVRKTLGRLTAQDQQALSKVLGTIIG